MSNNKQQQQNISTDHTPYGMPREGVNNKNIHLNKTPPVEDEVKTKHEEKTKLEVGQTITTLVPEIKEETIDDNPLTDLKVEDTMTPTIETLNEPATNNEIDQNSTFSQEDAKISDSPRIKYLKYLTTPSKNGTVPLINYCANTEMLTKLIKEYPEIVDMLGNKNLRGHNALFYAIFYCNPWSIIEIVKQSRIPISDIDYFQRNFFHYMALNWNSYALNIFTQNYEISHEDLQNMFQQVDAYGQLPLHMAIRAKSYHVVRYFCELGVNLTAREGTAHYTPLHLAAELGDEIMVAYLLKFLKREDVDDFAADYSTPLHLGVVSNNEKVVKLLLNAGADPYNYYEDTSILGLIKGDLYDSPISKLIKEKVNDEDAWNDLVSYATFNYSYLEEYFPEEFKIQGAPLADDSQQL